MSDMDVKDMWGRKQITCCYCENALWVAIGGLNLTPFPVDGNGFEKKEKGTFDEVVNDRDRIFLKRAEKHGLLKAFADVVEVAKAEQIPHDMGKFLLTFFKTAQLKSVPKFALDFYMCEFPGKPITFLGAQGIIAVLADGQIKCFAPLESVAGSTVRSSTTNTIVARVGGSVDDLETWKRTRWGYVLSGSIMADEIRRIPVGGFARPRIEIKNR